MNTKQTTLTYFAVTAIALSALFAPWDLTGAPDHFNVTRFSPLFYPPDLSYWAKRELASSIFWLWAVIIVLYSALFAAFRSTTRLPKHDMSFTP
jgi:hypothetical protein